MIKIHETGLETAWEIVSKIPEFTGNTTYVSIEERLNKYKNVLILTAESDGKKAGFKIGYQIEEDVFYSWFGGVAPEFRKLGIAQQLLKEQERIVKEADYREIRVKSMNRYRAMLCMLVKNGYNINGYDNKGNHDNSKILFTKNFQGQSLKR